MCLAKKHDTMVQFVMYSGFTFFETLGEISWLSLQLLRGVAVVSIHSFTFLYPSKESSLKILRGHHCFKCYLIRCVVSKRRVPNPLYQNEQIQKIEYFIPRREELCEPNGVHLTVFSFYMYLGAIIELSKTRARIGLF